MPAPTFRDILNSNKLDARKVEIAGRAGWGDMIAGIRDRAFTQTASPIIDLTALGLPPARPGAIIRATAGAVQAGRATVIGSGTSALALLPNSYNVNFSIVVAGTSTALSVPAIAPNSTTVVVNAATDGGGAATSTAAQIAAAMSAQATVTALFSSIAPNDGTGAGVMVAQAATLLGPPAAPLAGATFVASDSISPTAAIGDGVFTISGATNGNIDVLALRTGNQSARRLTVWRVISMVSQSLQLYVAGGEVIVILATGTTGSVTTTATALLALLNGTSAAAIAARQLFRFSLLAGDTGAGLVGTYMGTARPSTGVSFQGAYAPGAALLSADGTKILLPDNVTAGTLSYTPGPSFDLDLPYGPIPA